MSSLAIKKAIVAVVLAIASLWPLAHRVIVPIFDLNPWKFSGWAMYTVPSPPPMAFVLKIEAGTVVPIEYTPLVKRRLDEFRHRRRALGTLQRPTELARSVFEANPGLDEFIILVHKTNLDHKTALITLSKADYFYERDPFEKHGKATATDVFVTGVLRLPHP